MKNPFRSVSKNLYNLPTFNLILIIVEFLYLSARYKYLNGVIPLWMTMPWGTSQLAPKSYIFLLPALSLVILIGGLFFANNAKKRYQRYGESALIGIVTLANLLLCFSALRIVRVASSMFIPLVDPRIKQVITPALFAFTVVYFIAPRIIEKIKEHGIITDPQKHAHPGMVLTKPSARGGGVIFAVGVLITTILFIKPTPMILGILLSMALAAILGFLDDIQNTKPQARFAWLKKPTNRLSLQVFITLPLIVTGVIVNTVNNPFNGQIHFDSWKLHIGNIELAPIAIIFTILWILWIINLLSWSNGVDGQYSGVIGIAGLMVSIVTLRLLHFDPSQKDMMELAAIVAGASLGLLPYGWFPSKIMWGFGAISAGIVLAAISVVSQAKIVTSIIVLTVPFLDGVITVTRRILLKQSPLEGDRGHLHHLLLEKGWGVRRVAVFYWITTALFGLVGIYAADKDPILSALTGAGIVAFIIISLNISSEK